MKIRLLIIFCCLFGFLNAQQIQSPSKEISVDFSMTAQGEPTYMVTYKDKVVIKPSKMGVTFKDGTLFNQNFRLVDSETSTFEGHWSPVLGEETLIRDHYNQSVFHLRHKDSDKLMNIVIKVYDEGVAFRYEFPLENKVSYFVITDETTEFNLTEDYKTFWLPGDYDSQEYNYSETKLSEIDVSKLDRANVSTLQNIDNNYRVQTPLMLKSDDGLYLNIFEAAVNNYPVMHLNVDTKAFQLTSDLVPNVLGNKAYLRTPSATPWRTIMVSDDARDIVSSKMILNLNEPNKIEDTSWIKPMKYVGIWWEMHVGKAAWGYNYHNIPNKENLPSNHGARTENTKRYIDFAAEHGFDGVLVEGWNVGWEDWHGNSKEDVFDFITPYSDFDIEAIHKYAKSKGVKMIMHHETSGSVGNYERHLDRAMVVMKKYDYPAVKTGYVGEIIPRGEHHDGQMMVNHFNFVAQRMADNQIMVNAHESTRPTGFHRTYPNFIAAEAARGNEFNAWSDGNLPSHETVLPFTRLLGGPMDYTPGIFEIKMSAYSPNRKEQIHTTLAKQLALYVTLYSPLQMAADLPENYEKHLDAFQFIKDVPLDWQTSIYLEAEPGDYLTVVRKDKNSESWFLGAITDENPRKTEIKLSFLSPGKKYKAIIYEDGKDAHWEKNPKSYAIKTIPVTHTSKLKLKLAAGGGTAISFVPID